MKKLLFIFSILITIILSSCGNEALDQYVGTYSIYTNYHKTYHYYYGKTTVIKYETLIKRRFTLEIRDDASVIVTYADGEVINGRVSTTKEIIKFKNIEYVDKYTYTYKETKDGVILEYSYYPTKVGFEYDFESEGFSLIKKNPKEIKDEYIYSCSEARYSVKAYYPTYQNVLREDKNYNRLKYSKLTINLKNMAFKIEVDNIIQEGTFEINDRKYIFHMDSDSPLIPVEKEFLYEDNEEHYNYLSIRYSEYEEKEDYRLEYNYEILFYTYIK